VPPPTGGDPGSEPPSNGSGDDTAVARIGTAADDVLIGRAGDDVVRGAGGDDLILGNAGADTLKGDDGDDLIKGGAGDDVAFGNAGNDDVFGGAGRDMLFGDQGNDRLFADDGNDVIEGGAGNDLVYAGSGDDRVIATVNDGDDVYWGEDGQDTVDYSAYTADVKVDLGNGLLQHGSVTSTQGGNDAIFGFENFIGGSGNDTIIANAAVNVMDGGPGRDTFVFNSAADANGDVIKGFQPGDKIDLSGVDANTGASGNQSFVLFAGTGFTAAGQLMVTHEIQNGVEHTIVAGNTNNDNVADFKIDVVGNHALTPSDFHGVN
jgi:Ca2+-binding RTX toxin-like protein